MNRIITTLVQLMLVGGSIILGRMVWLELKQDMKDTFNDLRNKKQLQDPEHDLKLLEISTKSGRDLCEIDHIYVCEFYHIK